MLTLDFSTAVHYNQKIIRWL